MTADSDVLITGASDLDEVVSGSRSAGVIGMDTEFLREKTYRAKLCLVQVATDDNIYLIDPLQGLDLRAIADLIGDPKIEILVHAGKQDFELFYEEYGVVPANVFDVQLAAAFAGHGASLPYGRLVSELGGVQLVKGESYTDWCRRPLTSSQTRYAADDVRYLGGIATRLKEELESLGRNEWAREEMRRLFEDSESYRFDPGSAWRKVSGRGSLSPRQLTILKRGRSLARGNRVRAKCPQGVAGQRSVVDRDRPPSTFVTRRAQRHSRFQCSRGRPERARNHRRRRGGAAGSDDRIDSDTTQKCPGPSTHVVWSGRRSGAGPVRAGQDRNRARYQSN